MSVTIYEERPSQEPNLSVVCIHISFRGGAEERVEVGKTVMPERLLLRLRCPPRDFPGGPGAEAARSQCRARDRSLVGGCAATENRMPQLKALHAAAGTATFLRNRVYRNGP